MIRHLRIARIVLLLTAALASVLGWQKVSGWYSQSMREKAQNEIAWTAPEMEAGAVFYLALDRPTGQNGALLTFGLCRLPLATDAEASVPEASMNTIDEDLAADAAPDAMDGTQEEGPAQYVLFLPGAARKAGLRVHFREELSLDGQPLVTGQLLELAEGEHLLQTPDGEWPFTAVYGSELPCMFIETETGSLETIHRDKACVEGAGVTLLKADGTVAYGGWIDEMRGRGNSTWGYSEKRPYQITLAERASLLEMLAAKRWVLLANAYDPTLLCNQTVFSIAQSVGMPYTPESRQVELYINGEYRGCYLLSEKVEVDENRVNIPDTDELNAALIAKIKVKQAERYRKGSKSTPGGGRSIYYQLPAEAEAGTGGYLVELDFLFRVEETNHAHYVTRNEKALDIKCPALATEQQVEYIGALFQQLEDILIPPDGSTDDSSEALSRLVDLHSFVQKYLIDEIAKYNDANQTSLYMYKYPDSISTKLFAGPIWDYDTAFGASGILEEPEGFFANQPTSYSFWSGFYRQQVFQQETRRSFANEFVPVIEKMLSEEWILRRGRELTDTACMDALRWQGGACDPQSFLQEYRQTYQQEVQDIHDFLAIRMEFLKSEWLEEA